MSEFRPLLAGWETLAKSRSEFERKWLLSRGLLEPPTGMHASNGFKSMAATMTE